VGSIKAGNAGAVQQTGCIGLYRLILTIFRVDRHMRYSSVKTISYTRAAARALRKHRNMAPRITAKLKDYAANPASLANMVTEMVGMDCRRLRVGDFRVLFRETETQVVVLDVGPRGSIYD
jgi:mRNA interferase RelE/StbE